MTPSPAAGNRTVTVVSTLNSRLLGWAWAGRSPAAAPGLNARLRGCGSGAIALASFVLLPLAAAAVPMAPLTPGTPVAATPAGAPSGVNGPRRPGVIPPASLSRAGGSGNGGPQSPRRPVPGLKPNGGLTANK
jgi:hypothetical protein